MTGKRNILGFGDCPFKAKVCVWPLKLVVALKVKTHDPTQPF